MSQLQQISGTTRVATLIGWPATYSLSPALHNAAYSAMGEDIVYVVLPVETDIEAAINGLRALNFVGASVTLPHKEAVIPFLDEVTPAAQRLNAVNTIINRDGRLVGDNTDGAGFIDSLANQLNFYATDKRCVVVGAGGAARAVIAALDDASAAEVVVVNRNAARAADAATLADCGRSGDLDDIGEAELIVNATPVGMGDSGETPFDTHLISAGQVVIDLIYHPRQTALLAAAEMKGAQTLNGLGMLVFQAAAQIELWTGKRPPIDVMFKAIE